ncbi:hypothetical protein [Haliscomenobacter sp.]|uniref:hypothetical protein n=1 Tax=Haliscomenobacter sp. TaxID=2717303 RepID=UPI003BAAF0D4
MSTQNNRGRCLLFFLGMVLLSWGVYECQYQYSYWRDYQTRPWAYSKDKNAKLLVGEWQGTFTDPDGISKSIKLEIFEPLSDQERRKKAGRAYRRRTRGGLGSRKDTRLFDGIATVSSRLGQEDYVLHGSVGEDDFHQLKLQFGSADEAKRLQPNFALNLSESGQWAEDELTLKMGFAYFKADGSSFSDSADPRYDHIATLALKRK